MLPHAVEYKRTTRNLDEFECRAVIPFQFAVGTRVLEDGSVKVTVHQDLGFSSKDGRLSAQELERLGELVNSTDTTMASVPTENRPCIEELRYPDVGGPGDNSFRWDHRDPSIPRKILEIRDFLRPISDRILR